MKRLTSLDGLRGLACLVVFVFHVAHYQFPKLYDAHTIGSATMLGFLLRSPLSLLLNGHFMVQIFFMLSGVVVGMSAWKSSAVQSLCYPAKRYLRLMLPCIASLLLGALLLQKHLNLHTILSPNFNGGNIELNRVLWSITREMWGSLMLFWTLPHIANCATKVKVGLVITILALLYNFSLILFFPFFLGALLALVVMHREIMPYATLTFIFGAFLGVLPWAGSTNLSTLLDIAATALIVYGVIYSKALSALFSLRPFQWLGYHSFALYLVHMPLYLCCIKLGISWYVAMPLIIALVPLATKYIDLPCIKLSAYINKKLCANISLISTKN